MITSSGNRRTFYSISVTVGTTGQTLRQLGLDPGAVGSALEIYFAVETENVRWSADKNNVATTSFGPPVASGSGQSIVGKGNIGQLTICAVQNTATLQIMLLK